MGFAHFWFFPSSKDFTNCSKPPRALWGHLGSSTRVLHAEKSRGWGNPPFAPDSCNPPLGFQPHTEQGMTSTRGAGKKERCALSLRCSLVRRDHLSTGQRGKLTTAAWVFGFSRLSHNISWVPLLYEKRFWVISLETLFLQLVGLCSVLSAACLFPWLEKSWCFLEIGRILVIFLRHRKGLLRIANWEMSVWRQQALP